MTLKSKHKLTMEHLKFLTTDHVNKANQRRKQNSDHDNVGAKPWENGFNVL